MWTKRLFQAGTALGEGRRGLRGQGQGERSFSTWDTGTLGALQDAGTGEASGEGRRAGMARLTASPGGRPEDPPGALPLTQSLAQWREAKAKVTEWIRDMLEI